jgi:hypothetical protein
VLWKSDDKTRPLGTVTSCIVVTSYLREAGSFIRRAFLNRLFVVTPRVSVGIGVETSGKETRWFSECVKTVVGVGLGKKMTFCKTHETG